MKQNTHLLAHVAMSRGRGGTNSTPRSPPRRVTCTRRAPASRSTVSRSRSSAAWNWKSMASRSGVPLMATIRSPARSPAAAASERRRTAATTTPSAASSPSEQARLMLLALGGVGGVQEPHPLHDVLQPRGHREDGGQPDDRLRRHRQQEPVRAEAGEDGEDLEEGRSEE